MEKGLRHKKRLKKRLINGKGKSKRKFVNNFIEEEIMDKVHRKGTPYPKRTKLSLFASPPDRLNDSDDSESSFKASSPNRDVKRKAKDNVNKKILNRKKTPYSFRSLPVKREHEGLKLKRNLQNEYDDENYNDQIPTIPIISKVDYLDEHVFKNLNDENYNVLLPTITKIKDGNGRVLKNLNDENYNVLLPTITKIKGGNGRVLKNLNDEKYNISIPIITKVESGLVSEKPNLTPPVFTISSSSDESEDELNITSDYSHARIDNFCLNLSNACEFDSGEEISVMEDNDNDCPTYDEIKCEGRIVIGLGNRLKGDNLNGDSVVEVGGYFLPNSEDNDSSQVIEEIDINDDELEAEEYAPLDLEDENPLVVEKNNDDESLDEEYIEPDLEDEDLLENEDLLEDNAIIEVDDTDDDVISTKLYECVILKDAILLIINENTKLYFHGLMSATILQGNVEVLGYTLNPLFKDVELYSPRGSSFLYLQTRNDGFFPINKELIHIFCGLGMEDAAAEDLFKKLTSNSTVILCKKIVHSRIEFLQNFMPQQLFPGSNTNMPQCHFFNNIGDKSVLKIPEEWDEIIDMLKQNTKMLLCGGKSVGKSTMLRYMINKLLMRFPEVFVIDLDPGQPEFTLPGCISGHIVREPIFGPNFTHLMKPFRCLFVPHIDISYDPRAYLKEVEQLMQMLQPYVFKSPVLINYMGYTRGLGMDIFAASVALCQPDTLLEIHSMSSARNFRDDLDRNVLKEKAKNLIWLTSPFPQFSVVRVRSAADGMRGWCMQPRQIRESSILWYLGGVLPENASTLADPRVPLISVDLSKVHVIYDNEPTNFRNILGQLVALCSLNENENHSYICHGWGIVRVLKEWKRELYIVTPLELEELERNVRYLVLGSVTLPPTLIMATDESGARLPFVAKGFLEQMGKIAKRSHLSIKAITGGEN